MTIRPAVVLLAVLLLAADRPSDAPDPEWRQGPIRYILLVEEDAEFKTLATDEARAAFIEAFWRRLDPTAGTDLNEKRVEFWKRVGEADALFHEGIPGWRTERGKVYILMGPPDSRETGGPYDIWKYPMLPRPDADPGVTLRFRKTSEGLYRAPKDALEYWDPSHAVEGHPAGDTFLSVRTPNGSTAMAKGRLRMPATAAVAADYAVLPLECRLRYDFYRVKRDVTRMVVTAALDTTQFRDAAGVLQPPEVTLSVAVDDVRKKKPVGSSTQPMQLAGGATSVPGRPLVLQASLTLEPGTYAMTFHLIDARSHRGAVRVENLEAPEFGNDLTLSSVAIGRLRDDSGSAPLIPEPDTRFGSGETLAFAYEVYNAEHKGGSKPDLDVTYEFSIDTPGGARPVGKPVTLRHQQSESLAYSLPLRGWPEASYHISVGVTDNRTRRTATRKADFVIAEAQPGAPDGASHAPSE